MDCFHLVRSQENLEAESCRAILMTGQTYCDDGQNHSGASRGLYDVLTRRTS